MKAANDAIADVTKAVEYVAYQTALTGLAAAQQSTTSLNGLQNALNAAKEAEDATLNASKARSILFKNQNATLTMIFKILVDRRPWVQALRHHERLAGRNSARAYRSLW